MSPSSVTKHLTSDRARITGSSTKLSKFIFVVFLFHLVSMAAAGFEPSAMFMLLRSQDGSWLVDC